MVDRLISVVGLVLAVIPWILPNLSTPWKCVATLAVTTAAALSLSVYYYLRGRTAPIKTGEEKPDRFIEMENMNEAFRELLQAGVKKLRVLSYIGNFTWRSLLDASGKALDEVELRILIRDPNVGWKHPPSGCEQHKRRMDDISKVIDDLEKRSEFQKMAHRLGKCDRSSFVRFLQAEPQVRVVVGEKIDKSRLMYVGFYPLQVRGQKVMDFSGTKRPVLRVADGANSPDPLIDDFVSWFDFMWQLQAPGAAAKGQTSNA